MAATATAALGPGRLDTRTIRAALAHTGGDKTKAARILGISRTALYEKLKRQAGGAAKQQ